jgi:saccharopine dehydrogenase-like NADP-dependent oxidoreductase
VRILVVGTGGVGSAFARIARRRSFFEHCALADYDPARSERLVGELDDGRFSRHAIDASSRDAVVALIRETRANAVLNSVDPLFNVPVFEASFDAGVTYLDMAMTLSEPHPTNPYEEVGVKLGDYQFERAQSWEEKGLLALVGIGVEPGAADVFARHAADELFSEIDEIGVRDGANLAIEGYDFAPTFSIWTTIEECLNPPVVWEKDRGWFTTAPVLRAGGVRLPRRNRPGRVRERRARGGAQAVVWQTAINPVAALELLANGHWKGTGVLGPEAFPARPFLDKLEEYGSPHGVLELQPSITSRAVRRLSSDAI